MATDSIGSIQMPAAGWASFAETGQWMGSPRAPVKIVVFSDFMCPHCARQFAVLDSLQIELPDHVVSIFKHFPSSGGYAYALAAECFASQGRFKEFHDAAFRSAPSANNDVTWWTVARNIGGSDSSALVSCMDHRATMAAVEEDVTDARRLALSGTPTVFINGRRLDGAIGRLALDSLIVLELSTNDRVRQRANSARHAQTSEHRGQR